jgi:lysophospholipase L1-like esterase
MKLRLALGFLLFLSLFAANGQESEWITSWGASPVSPRLESAGPFQVTPSFSNQTIRQRIRLSAGGDRVRLRLSNEYGTGPLDVGAATLARVGGDGRANLDTIMTVTFGGDPSVTIAAGAPIVSDPIDLQVDELEKLSIALYFPGDTGICTCHPAGLQTAYLSGPGDFTSSSVTATETMIARAFLSGVEVSSAEMAHTIVLLGDSITDGVGSTDDANKRWPDRLAERLAEHSSDVSWGVVNAGISGNRVLSDGAGESALARFDRDVLAVSGVTHVVVLEGINDIGFGLGVLEGRLAEFAAGMPQGDISVKSMIAGYRQLIARTHSKGIKIYGATIIPYKGAAYFSEEGEAARQAINKWMRESGEFDAVLDFDSVLKDPGDPAQIADGMHIGDFLHGSDAGYQRIADSIDLSLFE